MLVLEDLSAATWPPPWSRVAARCPADAARRVAKGAVGRQSLLHLDVSSSNLCIKDGRCLLVDWSNAAKGNALLDAAIWLPSRHLEGGPEPDELAEDGMAELAVVFAGYLACRAGLAEPPSVPPPGVRPFQLAELRIALPWAARCLELAPPA